MWVQNFPLEILSVSHTAWRRFACQLPPQCLRSKDYGTDKSNSQSDSLSTTICYDALRHSDQESEKIYIILENLDIYIYIFIFLYICICICVCTHRARNSKSKLGYSLAWGACMVPIKDSSFSAPCATWTAPKWRCGFDCSHLHSCHS